MIPTALAQHKLRSLFVSYSQRMANEPSLYIIFRCYTLWLFVVKWHTWFATQIQWWGLMVKSYEKTPWVIFADVRSSITLHFQSSKSATTLLLWVLKKTLKVNDTQLHLQYEGNPSLSLFSLPASLQIVWFLSLPYHSSSLQHSIRNCFIIICSLVASRS